MRMGTMQINSIADKTFSGLINFAPNGEFAMQVTNEDGGDISLQGTYELIAGKLRLIADKPGSDEKMFFDYAVTERKADGSFTLTSEQDSNDSITLFAQEDPQEVPAASAELKKIAGSWKLNLEKSKEIMSEDEFESISKMGDKGLIITFGADSKYSMKVGEHFVLEDLDYTISLVEDAENPHYAIAAYVEHAVLRSKVFFVDETTIKFQPENDEAVIMERVVEEAPEADE